MVKTIADGSSVDTQLFGKDFPEKLKSAQALERSSKTIVKSTANSKYRNTISTLDRRRPSFGYKLSGNNNLNWKAPPAKNFRGASPGRSEVSSKPIRTEPTNSALSVRKFAGCLKSFTPA